MLLCVNWKRLRLWWGAFYKESRKTKKEEKIMVFGLSKRDIKIAIIFTIVEIVTLEGWLILRPGDYIGSIAILSSGLLIEHLISRIKG